MITFFTLPKPFTGLAKIHQFNAIKSWTLLDPRPEIILFGEEEGIAENALELGVDHVPDLEYNEYGTPLLNSAFDYVDENASFDTICYINADIILLPTFTDYVDTVHYSNFLLVGDRWNMDLNEPVSFQDREWASKLLTQAKEENQQNNMAGSDYFVYKKGSIDHFPPFAVGRPVWDNWMIYYFRKKGYPVINATPSLDVIHPRHGYEHVKSSNGNRYWGEEANRNIQLLGYEHDWFSLADVSHHLEFDGIAKVKLWDHFKRRPGQFKMIHPFLFILFSGVKWFLHLKTRVKVNVGKLVYKRLRNA